MDAERSAHSDMPSIALPCRTGCADHSRKRWRRLCSEAAMRSFGRRREKPCATLGRLSRKAGVGEAALRFCVKSWWQRPLAQSVEVALEMRRIDGTDNGCIHVRVAERKPKNELHRSCSIEQIVDVRPLPTFPLQPGPLSLRRSTLRSAAADDDARPCASCFGYCRFVLSFDR